MPHALFGVAKCRQGEPHLLFVSVSRARRRRVSFGRRNLDGQLSEQLLSGTLDLQARRARRQAQNEERVIEQVIPLAHRTPELKLSARSSLSSGSNFHSSRTTLSSSRRLPDSCAARPRRTSD